MACSGRGYVTIVGRKRLWSDQDELTDELTRVGIELLGQLKNKTSFSKTVCGSFKRKYNFMFIL